MIPARMPQQTEISGESAISYINEDVAISPAVLNYTLLMSASARVLTGTSAAAPVPPRITYSAVSPCVFMISSKMTAAGIPAI